MGRRSIQRNATWQRRRVVNTTSANLRMTQEQLLRFKITSTCQVTRASGMSQATTAQTVIEVDQMLAQLEGSGSTSNQGMVANDIKMLDTMADADQDEEQCRIEGDIVMQHGKHAGKMTVRQVYLPDKSYISRVRTHANRHSCKSIMQLRVYAYDRDRAKAERLRQINAQKKTEVPKRMASEKVQSKPRMTKGPCSPVHRGQRRQLLGEKMEWQDSPEWEWVSFEGVSPRLALWGKAIESELEEATAASEDAGSDR